MLISIRFARLAVTLFTLFAFLNQNAFAADGFIQTTDCDKTEAKLFKKKTSGKPKIGLALGGGGARGAAQVGVLKVLHEEGIKFDYIVGTSIGAVVGGFYCAGVTPDEMREPFLSGKLMKHFMTVPLWFRVLVEPVLIMPRVFGSRSYDGLYKGNTFRKYLVGDLSVHEHQIEKLPIKFAAVVFNYLDGMPYRMEKGNLGYAMQASCAVPTLRKPVEIDGMLLGDGGVVCNLPVKQCREMGADFVISVNIDQSFKPMGLDDFRHPTSVTKRMVNWGLYNLDYPQEDMADVIIHPDVDGISLISTSKKDAKRAMENGEIAARAALPALRSKLAELASK